MKNKLEVRILKTAELCAKFGKDEEKSTISGYAAVFNSLSADLGGFQEKIAPGAFKDAIKSSDVRALFNHNPDYVLGRQSNETLRIKEDSKGLHMEVDPPDTQIIRDLVLAPIARGDVREQSFAFYVESDKWEGLDGSKEVPIRTILKVSELVDVSPVTYPAYPDTTVAARSLEAAKKSAKEAVNKPAFVPLTVSELLRNYADAWDDAKATADVTKDQTELKNLFSDIMSELTERFGVAKPTQSASDPNAANPSKPTQAGIEDPPSKPTQASGGILDRERFEKFNERYNKKVLGLKL